MRIDLGSLRLDILDDGLFELRPETFVKVSKGRFAEMLNKTKFRPRIKVGFNSLLIRGEGGARKALAGGDDGFCADDFEPLVQPGI